MPKTDRREDIDLLRAQVGLLQVLSRNNQQRREEVEARHGELLRQNGELREAGNDLMDALLTAAPSTMYPRIVQHAMSAWQDAIGLPEGKRSTNA